MTVSKFMAFAGTIAALSSISFAWNISGVVISNAGQPLPGVKVTSPNYPGIETASTATGTFSLTNDVISLRATKLAKLSISYDNNIITLSNVKAQTITVSVMDALGKVAFSKTQHYVDGNMVLDLNKTSAKGVKFIRINADGHRNTYMLDKNVTLLKEGDPLPSLLFQIVGYSDKSYTMTKEVEEGVYIIMEPGTSNLQLSSAAAPASSSSEVAPTSSSDTPASSSSVVATIDCSAKTLKTDTQITVDGRKVIVRFPSGYVGDKPVPMLINYHQIFGSADDWTNNSKIGKVALANGAISIYPDGALTPNGEMGQAWNVGPCCTDADDVQFTRDIIKEMTEKACVDPKRIYTAGWSMGGGMANYAGCMLADVVAAGASSAFDLAEQVTGAGLCKPARPYPILNFRSTNDGVVNYNRTESQIVPGKPITFLGAEANFTEWAKMNGCTGDPTKDTPASGCDTYENCQGGAKVTLCRLNIDHNEGDPEVGWNFLKQFSLP